MQRNAISRIGRLTGWGLATGAALALLVAPAQAQTTNTATIDYSVTVVAAAPTCSFTVPAVDWGTVPNDSPSLFRGYVLSFDCTGAVATASLSFDGGQNPGTGGLYTRAMSNGTDPVRYSITESGTGLGIDEVTTFALPAGPSTRSYGSTIPGIDLQAGSLGTYSDQVVATFTF